MKALLSALLSSFLCWFTVLPAREVPVQVETQLIALSLYDAVDGLYMWDGEKPVPFHAAVTDMRQPIPYKGPSRLVLHDTPEAFLVEEPEQVPPPVAVVELPENAERVLLLCLKRESQPLRIVAYPVSFDSIQPGDYRFFNFASTPIRILLGDKNLTLNSGTVGTLTADSWRKDRKDLPIKLAAPVNGEVRMVKSTIWGHQPQKRYFVLIFDGSHISRPVVVRRVHDREPPPPPVEDE